MTYELDSDKIDFVKNKTKFELETHHKSLKNGANKGASYERINENG
jgi:hypothetical protein